MLALATRLLLAAWLLPEPETTVKISIRTKTDFLTPFLCLNIVGLVRLHTEILHILNAPPREFLFAEEFPHNDWNFSLCWHVKKPVAASRVWNQITASLTLRSPEWRYECGTKLTDYSLDEASCPAVSQQSFVRWKFSRSASKIFLTSKQWEHEVVHLSEKTLSTCEITPDSGLTGNLPSPTKCDRTSPKYRAAVPVCPRGVLHIWWWIRSAGCNIYIDIL